VYPRRVDVRVGAVVVLDDVLPVDGLGYAGQVVDIAHVGVHVGVLPERLDVALEVAVVDPVESGTTGSLSKGCWMLIGTVLPNQSGKQMHVGDGQRGSVKESRGRQPLLQLIQGGEQVDACCFVGSLGIGQFWEGGLWMIRADGVPVASRIRTCRPRC
jgi:hypothetical protein